MRVKPKNWGFEHGKFHIKSDRNREEHRQTGKECSKKTLKSWDRTRSKKTSQAAALPKATACTLAEKTRLWPTGWYRSLAARAPWPKRLGGKPTQGAVSLLASGTCAQRPPGQPAERAAAQGAGLQGAVPRPCQGMEGGPKPGAGAVSSAGRCPRRAPTGAESHWPSLHLCHPRPRSRSEKQEALFVQSPFRPPPDKLNVNQWGDA